MTTTIADLLTELQPPGSFATRLRASMDDLEVEVKGVGRLRGPISEAMADKLRRVARPAPFGLRDATLFDASVRSTWEIPKSRVKIAARPWKEVLAAHLREVQRELGIPEGCRLEPVFDKLLLYDRGQFFKPHQDSERSDDMVGSLVVVLPSKYTGGSFTVTHQGERKVFRRLKHQDTDLSLIAFYADTQHEIEPIKSGHRVALTYHLRLESGPCASEISMDARQVEELRRRIAHHFETPIAQPYPSREPRAPRRLVYLLDHEYTERSLSWDRLKGADRPRVAALRAVAEALDCECFLALADVHETWSCDGDYPYDGFWGRRRYRDFVEDERDPDDYELIDLQDSTIELRHFVGIDGRSGGIKADVDRAELSFTKPSRDMAPFESQHEGWQGNYGNTVDRWYHRAALVMWPTAHAFLLRAEGAPEWAVDELLKLPPERAEELESKVQQLLPDWRRCATQVEGAGFFAKVMDLALRLGDGEAAARLVEPVGAERLGSAGPRRGLVALVEKYGLDWGKQLLDKWTDARDWAGRPWLRHLREVCAGLIASDRRACRELSAWLIEREARRAREHCEAARERSSAWLDLSGFEEEAQAVAHVLAAAVVTGGEKLVRRELKWLAGTSSKLPLALRLAVLRALIARGPELREHVTGSQLLQRTLQELDALLGAPLREPDNWSIEHGVRCGCADCVELGRFLRSRDVSLDWPLAKDRRAHVHGILDSNGLPVSHTTLRRGSPYVLRLRKKKSLFSREIVHRKQLAALRKELAS